MAPFFDL